MTNVLKSLGWNQVAIATEHGWKSLSGELLVSSRNLLTNRVLKGYASSEEIFRWADIKNKQLQFEKNIAFGIKEKNQVRLKELKEKFENDTLELRNKAESDVESKILLLQKELEFSKLEKEYNKSFAASDVAIENFDRRIKKVQARVDAVVDVEVPEEQIEEPVEVPEEPVKEVKEKKTSKRSKKKDAEEK